MSDDRFPLKPGLFEALAKDYGAGAHTNRQVKRLTYRHDGVQMVSEVGEPESDGMHSGYVVFAIVEPAAGGVPWAIIIGGMKDGELVFRRPALLVGQSNVVHVEDFPV